VRVRATLVVVHASMETHKPVPIAPELRAKIGCFAAGD
jgi:acyl-CoA thioesterase FadM